MSNHFDNTVEAWVAVQADEYKRLEAAYDDLHNVHKAQRSRGLDQVGKGMHSTNDIKLPLAQPAQGEDARYPPTALDEPVLNDGFHNKSVTKSNILMQVEPQYRHQLEHILNFITKDKVIEFASDGAIKIHGLPSEINLRDIAPTIYDATVKPPTDFSAVLNRINHGIRQSEHQRSVDESDEAGELLRSQEGSGANRVAESASTSAIGETGQVGTGGLGSGSRKPWYYIADFVTE